MYIVVSTPRLQEDSAWMLLSKKPKKLVLGGCHVEVLAYRTPNVSL